MEKDPSVFRKIAGDDPSQPVARGRTGGLSSGLPVLRFRFDGDVRWVGLHLREGVCDLSEAPSLHSGGGSSFSVGRPWPAADAGRFFREKSVFASSEYCGAAVLRFSDRALSVCVSALVGTGRAGAAGGVCVSCGFRGHFFANALRALSNGKGEKEAFFAVKVCEGDGYFVCYHVGRPVREKKKPRRMTGRGAEPGDGAGTAGRGEISCADAIFRVVLVPLPNLRQPGRFSGPAFAHRSERIWRSDWTKRREDWRRKKWGVCCSTIRSLP